MFFCFSHITFSAQDTQSYFELSEEDIAVVKNVGLELISFINLDSPFFHLKDSKLRTKAIKSKGCKARTGYYLSMKRKAVKLTSKGYLKKILHEQRELPFKPYLSERQKEIC